MTPRARTRAPPHEPGMFGEEARSRCPRPGARPRRKRAGRCAPRCASASLCAAGAPSLCHPPPPRRGPRSPLTTPHRRRAAGGPEERQAAGRELHSTGPPRKPRLHRGRPGGAPSRTPAAHPSVPNPSSAVVVTAERSRPHLESPNRTGRSFFSLPFFFSLARLPTPASRTLDRTRDRLFRSAPSYRTSLPPFPPSAPPSPPSFLQAQCGDPNCAPSDTIVRITTAGTAAQCLGCRARRTRSSRRTSRSRCPPTSSSRSGTRARRCSGRPNPRTRSPASPPRWSCASPSGRGSSAASARGPTGGCPAW